MDKAYNAQAAEDQTYTRWEESGLMKADSNSDKPPFSIMLPPPNVTGQLHLGHAAMLAIEDIMIRYKKMTGHEVLWLPGTDHAAIATESVVLKKHGIKDRSAELTRPDFMKLAESFVQETGGAIRTQMKKMGAWMDWDREAYTFDEDRSFAVNTIFNQLYRDDLIYRGNYLINWSTGAQSVISDDELEWDEVQEPFYYIRCGEFVIGTVRPETKCADSPLVVHPEAEYVKILYGAESLIVIKQLWDDRERFFKTLNFLDAESNYEVVETYKGCDLAGKKFDYETYAGKRTFYVLADEVIDPDKGAGAMTISSCHSADDYDLAKRRKLNDIWIEKIDKTGHMTDVAGPCAGLGIVTARKESGRLMESQGLLLGKDTSYSHRVPLCYRSNCVVEPMISKQWFIAVEKEYDHPVDGRTTIKKQMQAAVRENHVEIIPERFNKTYFQWIDNLRDWCISRQIWWGHPIPVWYDADENIHLGTEQEVILVRHGESTGNRDGLVQGVDEPLTEKGQQHARDLIQALEGEKIGAIVVGKSVRVHETADILNELLQVPVIEIPELSAFDTGEIAGKTFAEIGNVAAIKYCRDNGVGEDFEAFIERIKSGWEKLKQVKSDGKIVFVTNRSIYSMLQTIRAKRDTSAVFEQRSKNSYLPHGIIDRWQFLQAPEGGYRAEEDTLDTWFSSALWPFSTLGWPHKTLDFNKFYPTAVLETGWDIIFFWVARMIMFGRYATGEYPFKTVYLHGLVTDEHGKKMSKSKGNGIDPLDMVAKFGADPIRLSLVIGTSPGNPIPIGENKIKGYRNFVNKLWNAGRFVEFLHQNNKTDITTSIQSKSAFTGELSLADRWILDRFSTVSAEVAAHLEKYEISAAGDKMYHFVWDEFCDWYIESAKVKPNLPFITQLYSEILKLVHPLCPFVTEQIYRELLGAETCLIEGDFPQIKYNDAESGETYIKLQSLVSEVRRLRGEHKLNPKDKLKLLVKNIDESLLQEVDLINLLANTSQIETVGKFPEGTLTSLVSGIELGLEVPYDPVQVEVEKAKKVIELKKQIVGLEGRLSNSSYTEKAPAHLVQQTRDQLTEAQNALEKLTA